VHQIGKKETIKYHVVIYPLVRCFTPRLYVKQEENLEIVLFVYALSSFTFSFKCYVFFSNFTFPDVQAGPLQALII